MTLQDISNGPDWIMWVTFAVFAVITMMLLSGHGSGLIAGYNTASKAKKSKYDEKKLCRVTGIGMFVITILLFIMVAAQSVLPAYFAHIFAGIVIVDCIIIIILSNTICKK